MKNIIKHLIKGDRISLTFKGDAKEFYNSRNFPELMECEVIHVYVGILHVQGYDRNGKEITKFYTKEYAEQNNIKGYSSEYINLIATKKDGSRKEINVFINTIDTIKIGLNKKFDKWIDKAFDYANSNSDDCDIIYKSINKYKALKELNEQEKDIIYDLISARLGY